MRAARTVTEVFAPGILTAAVLVAVGWHSGGVTGVAWAAVAAVFCCFLPLAILLWGVRRGIWEDLHVKAREQRVMPLLAMIASVFAGAVTLASFDNAPRELVALEVAMLAGLCAVLTITTWWKVSIHTTVVSGVLAVLTQTYGLYMIAATPLVALIAWSRVVLGDHTVAQTMVGSVVGAVIAAGVFSVVT